MIRLNYKSDTYLIKNALDEIKINEFEFISTILNSDSSETVKWKTILHYLDVPYSVLNELDSEQLLSIVKPFDLADVKIGKFVTKIKIGKQIFLSPKFITVKQIALVEEYLEKDNINYIGELIAIIFCEKGKTKDEHLNDVTIKKNGELFRYSLNMDKALPYINLLTANIFTKYNN